MSQLGQSSGAFQESSSALRIEHAGVRNATGVLSDDAFTQTNPPVSTGTDVSTNLDTGVAGVLSGSVAFARPDAGSNFHGGPASPAGDIARFVRPLGVYVNSAAGQAFENQPAAASGKNTYMSSQGTYGNKLFETQVIEAAAAPLAQGDPLPYVVGAFLVASVNGLLMPSETLSGGAIVTIDAAARSLELANGNAASTIMGVVKMPADAVQDEILYDQRV